MSSYNPPLNDMAFTLAHVLDARSQWAKIPAFKDLDQDTAMAVIEQAGTFASELLAPINATGDEYGCAWTPEGVHTPPGFREAYAAFVEQGWPALACAPEHGGQGLPHLLNAALYEMLAGANHGWTMYPGLLYGAYETLAAHASPEVQSLYLPHIVSGEYLATMCLSEPQAGSDLGLIRTRGNWSNPDQVGNGARVHITGSKVFISGGDSDMSSNLVHLVLFRLPEAPTGTKGISLALVPKYLPDGTKNKVFADSIEKKMGIHGSATCQMRFEQAEGWLIGEPHQGLRAMFLMMNAARLHVALQGLGHLEAATQGAWAYAKERLQMRAPQRAAGTPREADPIAFQPAMRRVLWRLRARTDGGRVFAYWLAQRLDEAHHHPDAQERQCALSDVNFLTPVAKAFLTDLGHRSADEALQVWGGYGYVREFGIEQTVRDSRIAMIYEGTNEIQAIDLIQRKFLADGGAHAEDLITRMAQHAAIACARTPTRPFGESLELQIKHWRAAHEAILLRATHGIEHVLEVADDYLQATGHTMLAWAWTQIALACMKCAETQPTSELEARLASAQHGINYLLDDALPHWARLHRAPSHLASIQVDS